MKTCDIVLIGVGGQGVVTLGDLIAQAALAADVSVQFVPTKGMAQRGGFVKADIRLGYETAGPRVPEQGADILLSMERSETLNGLAYLRPGSRVILYDHVWAPTGVQLGEHAYPKRDEVLAVLNERCGEVLLLDPGERPEFNGTPVVANMYVLGALAGSERLRSLIDSRLLEQGVIERWPRAAESNLAAFQAGFAQANGSSGRFLGTPVPPPTSKGSSH